jgi:hypothetical protein
MPRPYLSSLSIASLVGCASGNGGDRDSSDDDGVADESSGGATDGGSDSGGTPPSGAFGDPDGLGPTGLSRLSLAELSASLHQLTGLPEEEITTLLSILPGDGDGDSPFDNDAALQTPSGPFTTGMLSIAESIASRMIDDPTRRDAFLGCTPSGPDDAACLRGFAERFGRRVLRQPLSPAELDEYAAFIEHAQADGSFDIAARMVTVALLLDARFLYRVEVGTPVPDRNDLVALTSFELATRMAFLMWGEAPDDALLDRAQAGELDDPDGVREVAGDLLRDARGLRQIQRMHALWLGYENLAMDPALATSLRAETDALVERALVDRAWTSMFTAEQTWLDEISAAHYDLALPGGQPGWVDYPDIRRRGLLSHGTLLALGAKFGDTSPTERGKAIWKRMLCNEIPNPPPEVDTGLPPSGGPADACKTERYDMRTTSECSTCHEVLDGIGFGLENYGAEGQWRTTEPGKPECSIDGEGSLAGIGTFAGAGALGELLLDTGTLEGCYATNMLHFAIGREPADDDAALLHAMTASFEETDDAVAMLIALATSEAFAHRRLE